MERFLYPPAVDVPDAAVVSSTTLAARVSELEAAVAARDRFIAAVGHELRNVMAPLVLLADAAKVAAAGAPRTGGRRCWFATSSC